jgi:Protein of unknown function (DUF1151)
LTVFFFLLNFSGKTVLNQKTELQRALEKQKERHVIAAQNEMNKDCTSSLHGELGKVRKAMKCCLNSAKVS